MTVKRNIDNANYSGNESGYLDDADESRNAAFQYLLGRIVEDGGDADDITASLLHDTGFALQDGAFGFITPEETNTGAMTLNIESTGALSWYNADGDDHAAGEIVGGTTYMIGYVDGSPGHYRSLS